MDDREINVVTKTEHHVLATCPCEACSAERRRREPPAEAHVKRLTVEAAYMLGFLQRRNPHGSLARQLMTGR